MANPQDLMSLLTSKRDEVNNLMNIDQTEKQKRDSMLLAFVNANPGMMNKLGVRSQEYIKQLLAKQGS